MCCSGIWDGRMGWNGMIIQIAMVVMDCIIPPCPTFSTSKKIDGC